MGWNVCVCVCGMSYLLISLLPQRSAETEGWGFRIVKNTIVFAIAHCNSPHEEFHHQHQHHTTHQQPLYSPPPYPRVLTPQEKGAGSTGGGGGGLCRPCWSSPSPCQGLDGGRCNNNDNGEASLLLFQREVRRRPLTIVFDVLEWPGAQDCKKNYRGLSVSSGVQPCRPQHHTTCDSERWWRNAGNPVWFRTNTGVTTTLLRAVVSLVWASIPGRGKTRADSGAHSEHQQQRQRTDFVVPFPFPTAPSDREGPPPPRASITTTTFLSHRRHGTRKGGGG
jgi:hypothetical protein